MSRYPHVLYYCGGGHGVVEVVEENNRNVVVEEENYRILWPSNLYKCATSYHFLNLHSAPEEMA